MHLIIIRRKEGLPALTLCGILERPVQQLRDRFLFLRQFMRCRLRHHEDYYRTVAGKLVQLEASEIEEVRLLEDGQDITEDAIKEAAGEVSLQWDHTVRTPRGRLDVLTFQPPIPEESLGPRLDEMRRRWADRGQPPTPAKLREGPVLSSRLLLEGVDITGEVEP